MNGYAKYLKNTVDVVLPAAEATDIYERVSCGQAAVVTFELANTGANPLTAFSLQIRAHPDATYQTKLSSWAAAGAVLLFVSGAPSALAGGGVCTCQVRLDGVFSYKFVGTSTLGTSANIKLIEA